MIEQISKKNILIVEGEDEKRFFNSLILNLQLVTIQVLPIGGKTKLKDTLPALAKSSDFKRIVESIGIVRDADESDIEAFQSVCASLGKVNLPVPTQPLMSVGGKPKVVVMIMPGTGKIGMLEDLCLDSIIDNPATACIDEYFNCVKGKNFELPSNLSKAKVHAFLSIQKKSFSRLGEAAEMGIWPWHHAAFEEVKIFLNLLSS